MSEIKIYKQIFPGQEVEFINSIGLSIINFFGIQSFFHIIQNDSLFYKFFVYEVNGEDLVLLSKLETSKNAFFGKELNDNNEITLYNIVEFPYTSVNNLKLVCEKNDQSMPDYMFKIVLSYEQS